MGKNRKLKDLRRQMKTAKIQYPKPTFQDAKEKRWVTMAEAKELMPKKTQAQLDDLDWRDIKGEQRTFVESTIQVRTNHYRAMGKAWLKDGYKGVEDYYDKVQAQLQADEQLKKGVSIKTNRDE